MSRYFLRKDGLRMRKESFDLELSIEYDVDDEEQRRAIAGFWVLIGGMMKELHDHYGMGIHRGGISFYPPQE